MIACSQFLRLSLLLVLLCPGPARLRAAEPAEPAPTFEEVLARAQQGEIIMQLTVGRMYEERGSYTNAVRWYLEAARTGDPGSQFKLGLLHAQGHGVTRDMSLAIQWFEKSARQGFAAAQYNLGVCWEKGLGTPKQDYAEARKWYQLAAAQNDAYAQKALGVFYEKGLGTKPDTAEAYKWYALAATGGLSDGETLRKNLAARFKPEELADAQKRFTDYAAARAANSKEPPPRLPVDVSAKAPAKPKTKDFLE